MLSSDELRSSHRVDIGSHLREVVCLTSRERIGTGCIEKGGVVWGTGTRYKWGH